MSTLERGHWRLLVDIADGLAHLKQSGEAEMDIRLECGLTVSGQSRAGLPLDSSAVRPPQSVSTLLGNSLEVIAAYAEGRTVQIASVALSALAGGHRVAFVEIFCCLMRLTQAVRATGLAAPDGIDRIYTIGGRRWDLEIQSEQDRCQDLLDTVDPVCIHGAPPCTKLTSLAPHEGQPSYDAAGYERAVGMVDWMVSQVDRREAMGGGGSVESPERSRFWKIPSVVKYFGTEEHPRDRRYFTNPHMCCYGLRDPAQPDKLYRKPLRLAATFPELREVDARCPGEVEGEHEHLPIRGSVKLLGGSGCRGPASQRITHVSLRSPLDARSRARVLSIG